MIDFANILLSATPLYLRLSDYQPVKVTGQGHKVLPGGGGFLAEVAKIVNLHRLPRRRRCGIILGGKPGRFAHVPVFHRPSQRCRAEAGFSFFYRHIPTSPGLHRSQPAPERPAAPTERGH